KLPEKATFFLMFVTILLAAQFRSKRFAEYFPPFAVLFAAFSWQAFTMKKAVELPDEFKREIEPYLDVNKKTEKQELWQNLRHAGVWLLGILLFAYFMVNMVGLQRFGIEHGGLIGIIKSNGADDTYQRAMAWATGVDENGVENIPAGQRFFNASWDDFPKLFFFNTKHTYVYGLDPNYLFSENPELYKLLTEIAEGKKDEAGPLIREKFGAHYVFVDAKENEDMVAKLLESGWANIVYEDDESRILKIREQKGEAPSEARDEPETEEEKRQLDEEERSANSNANSTNSDEEEDK
ncbi:MAG: hypothetical protein ACT4O9_14825, partial [Blastocatellia bacterium]